MDPDGQLLQTKSHLVLNRLAVLQIVWPLQDKSCWDCLTGVTLGLKPVIKIELISTMFRLYVMYAILARLTVYCVFIRYIEFVLLQENDRKQCRS